MPNFERFDVAEAYYVFATHYHKGGDTSDCIMARLDRREFKPGDQLGGSDSGPCHYGLSENGYGIYSRLVKTHPDAQGARELLGDPGYLWDQ